MSKSQDKLGCSRSQYAILKQIDPDYWTDERIANTPQSVIYDVIADSQYLLEQLREQERSEWAESFHKKPLDDKSSIREQVRANMDAIEQTEVLFCIDPKERSEDFSIVAQRLRQELSQNNGLVRREGFGDVQVSDRIKRGAAYFKSVADRISVLAIPAIIEKGIQIGKHINHKGRGYVTFTFAGKVEMGEHIGVMCVVVQRTTGNYYRLHQVFSTNGDILNI